MEEKNCKERNYRNLENYRKIALVKKNEKTMNLDKKSIITSCKRRLSLSRCCHSNQNPEVSTEFADNATKMMWFERPEVSKLVDFERYLPKINLSVNPGN